MLRFKTFITEDKKENSGIIKLEHLPLYMGHQGVETSADMLDAIHNSLLDKKPNNNVKAIVNHDGLPISFGYDPKEKRMHLTHKGIKNRTFEDIRSNYANNPKLITQLMMAAEHLPKVLPQRIKNYKGTIIPSIPNQLVLSLETNEDGSPLKDSDRLKFGSHPDVNIINPTLRGDPMKYSPDEQQQYMMLKKDATDRYRKMHHDSLDLMNGHEHTLSNHIDDMHDIHTIPSVDSYLEDLKQKYTSKIMNSDSDITKNNRLKRFSDLSQEVSDNHKHFENVIDLIHKMKLSKNILSQIIDNNNLPSNVTLHKDGIVSRLVK